MSPRPTGSSDPRRRYFAVDTDGPERLRPLDDAEALEADRAARDARWEPATMSVPSTREDVPLSRLSEEELGRTADAARSEVALGGAGALGAATVARAVDAELARRAAEQERVTGALDDLLDRAERHLNSTQDGAPHSPERGTRDETREVPYVTADRDRIHRALEPSSTPDQQYAPPRPEVVGFQLGDDGQEPDRITEALAPHPEAHQIEDEEMEP